MALVNYSLPFGSLGGPSWATMSPIHSPPHATAVNSLLYGPSPNQENDLSDDNPDYFKNSPYLAHTHQFQQQQQQQAFRNRNNNYLPPISSSRTTPSPTSQYRNTYSQNSRTYGESSYTHSSQSSVFSNVQSSGFQQNTRQNQNQNQNQQSTKTSSFNSQQVHQLQHQHQQQHQQFFQNQQQQQQPQQQKQVQTAKPPVSSSKTTSTSFSSTSSSFNSNSNVNSNIKTNINTNNNNNSNNNNKNGKNTDFNFNNSNQNNNNNKNNNNNNNNGNVKLNQGGYPERPPGFTKVQAGQGSRTQVHAVLDYDDDEDYYEDDEEGRVNKGDKSTPVTPIQGPIFIKNDSVPVLPLYAYPKVYNGTFMQIPIWWTALSVALGLNVRGDVIKGIPCVKRNHQLFCPSAGSSYPLEKIETFIDENKALMKRMYGSFDAENEYGASLKQGRKRKRMLYEDDFNPPPLPELDELYGIPGEGPNPIRDAGPTGDSYFNKIRNKRQSQSSSRGRNQSQSTSNNNNSGKSDTGRVDACESKVEIVTPYWASNSAGKIRAIVNTQHFEQAIHQEVCSKVQTNRCAGECGCEQKYKWHRLLAYDPDNDCKGIFMDWFLFPSCCVCRCNPL
jgi:hypothetical protein